MKAQEHCTEKKTKIKYLFVIAMCMLAIALGLHQAIAAYISVSNMKAVVSTNENEALFNSNLLYGYRSNPANIESNSIMIDSDSDTVTITVSIFNYHKQDNNLVNPLDVKYDFIVEASGAPDSDYSKYTYTFEDATSTGQTYNKDDILLPGRTACKQDYVIKFPKSHLDYAQFKVVATVDNSGGGIRGTNIYCLAAVIVPSRHSEVSSPSVSGQIVEKSEISSPSNYDAYNYEVTVGGMASEIEISWNTSYVEIDPFFASEPGVTVNVVGELGTAKLTMEPGTRIIQFYRVNNHVTETTQWSDLRLNVRKL